MLTKRAAFLAVARILAFSLTIPLPLVLVRTLSQSDFGLYKQIFQIMMTVLALTGLGVNMSVLYFLPRNPDKKPQIALNVLAFYAVIGSLVALFFAVYPRWVTIIFKGDGLVPHIPLLGVAILLWLLSTVLEVVAVADNDMFAEGAVRSYLALKKAGVPAELHVYASGGHGFGIRPQNGPPVNDWTHRLEAWLRYQKLLERNR